MPIDIVLVTNRSIVCHGLHTLLDRNGGIRVIGEAFDSGDVVSQLRARRPDVVVFSCCMPKKEVVQTLNSICKEGIPVPFLILFCKTDDRLVFKAAKSGVLGCVLNIEPLDRLIEAIKTVASGGHWFSAPISARIAELTQEGGRLQRVQDALTDRELEALELLSTGKTNKAISEAMGISEKTVEKYISHIFRKLGLASRVEVAVYAVKNKLV